MNPDASNRRDLVEKDVRKVRVMLVDDDPVFIKIVSAQLRTHHRNELDIVGIARSGEECIIKAQALAPKIVLMDLQMPGRGGLWAIPLLQIIFPETRVIALSHRNDADSRRAVLGAGGTDLVSKTAWKTDLIPAIQRAMESETGAESRLSKSKLI
jgi:DNA-binding NarL/FixJ family response regulator